jgi:2'-5' RNA ligase
MLNGKYEYSSVHIEVLCDLSQKIINWGIKNIQDKDIYYSKKKEVNFGREDEIHVTILYGIHSDCPKKTTNIIKDYGQVNCCLGEIKIFKDPEGYDVVVIDVLSEDLFKLNELIVKNIKHTNKYKIYKPHITIAYVKKNKNWDKLNKDFFKDIKFTSNHAVFSSKNGLKYGFFL